MAIKTLLVHLDDGTHTAVRLQAAAQLARDSAARLIGAYITPTLDVAPSVAALLPQDLVERRLREAMEAQRAAEEALRSIATRAGVEAVEWRAPAGDAFAAAVAHARCCDLAVLGQADPADPRAPFSTELLTAVLLGAGRPILAIPYTGTRPTLGKRILVATDGGREAARAIGDAMPLLRRASEVRVLVGTPSSADMSATFPQASARITRWLRDHGIEAMVEPYDAPFEDQGDWLLSRAADFSSDLLVMGGYGHARLRETVLGGMTRTLLRAMTVPVLMSH